ncbi:MAG TPA: DUF2721 domain-containing protein [Armatimonadota bacterium]|jgi:hypothetical protein
MTPLDLKELSTVLQTSVSPVILVSGVGLLLLSMTNRFARTAERARELGREIRQSGGEDDAALVRQVRIMYRRSQILRRAITLASTSIFLVSLLIWALFTLYWLKVNLQPLVVLLFIISVLCLAGSMASFIQDVTLSLHALKEEVEPYLDA